MRNLITLRYKCSRPEIDKFNKELDWLTEHVGEKDNETYATLDHSPWAHWESMASKLSEFTGEVVPAYCNCIVIHKGIGWQVFVANIQGRRDDEFNHVCVYIKVDDELMAIQFKLQMG